MNEKVKRFLNRGGGRFDAGEALALKGGYGGLVLEQGKGKDRERREWGWGLGVGV